MRVGRFSVTSEEFAVFQGEATQKIGLPCYAYTAISVQSNDGCSKDREEVSPTYRSGA